MSVISIVVSIRSPTGGLPHPRQPPQMTATMGSSPMTQLSCPGGMSKMSPGRTANSVPSSIRPSMAPDRHHPHDGTGSSPSRRSGAGRSNSASQGVEGEPADHEFADPDRDQPCGSSRVSSGTERFFVRGPMRIHRDLPPAAGSCPGLEGPCPVLRGHAISVTCRPPRVQGRMNGDDRPGAEVRRLLQHVGCGRSRRRTGTRSRPSGGDVGVGPRSVARLGGDDGPVLAGSGLLAPVRPDRLVSWPWRSTGGGCPGDEVGAAAARGRTRRGSRRRRRHDLRGARPAEHRRGPRPSGAGRIRGGRRRPAGPQLAAVPRRARRRLQDRRRRDYLNTGFGVGEIAEVVRDEEITAVIADEEFEQQVTEGAPGRRIVLRVDGARPRRRPDAGPAGGGPDVPAARAVRTSAGT